MADDDRPQDTSKRHSSAINSADVEAMLADYNDLGMVEIWHDDSQDIFKILDVENASIDKLMYTVFSMNIFFTCFMVGFVPNYFYIWHTTKALTLITYRWYTYRKKRYHYFLFDFCYFTNILLLLYLWLPEQLMGPIIRGRLFTTCFVFANGPLLWAIMMWRNSLVPHSNDKMTSLFIHVSSALTTFGLRCYRCRRITEDHHLCKVFVITTIILCKVFAILLCFISMMPYTIAAEFSTPEQRFPICSGQQGFLISGCSGVGMREILLYPMLMYWAWQLLYILVVELMFQEKVEKHDYATSYKFMMQKSKTSLFVRLCSILGPRYRKLMFILLQFVYSVLSVLMASFSYSYMEVNMLMIALVMGFASYNGACFYIDVFSQKYKIAKAESAKST